RYVSAAEFAADLQRHLDHDLVLARAPSLGYRLKKLVRRNRMLVTSLGLLVACSLAIAVVSWNASVRQRSLTSMLQDRNDLEEATRLLAAADDLLPVSTGNRHAVREWLDRSSTFLEALQRPVEQRIAPELGVEQASTRTEVAERAQRLASTSKDSRR